MSVYIKGMEMPWIEHQEIDIRHGADGKWYAIDDGEWYEIIPVPDHGRLIDADAALKKLNRICLPDDLSYTIGHDIAKQFLNDAPTIIPAEESAKTEEDTEPWLCLSCRHYPPSSTDGKPCSQCNPSEVLHSCYDPAEDGE